MKNMLEYLLLFMIEKYEDIMFFVSLKKWNKMFDSDLFGFS